MTDQSPTAAFTASSFLDGANADYVAPSPPAPSRLT
jgi:hypothetical protein